MSTFLFHSHFIRFIVDNLLLNQKRGKQIEPIKEE